MQSKGNVLFSGYKRLPGFGIQCQKVMYIALLVLYLTVRLVETKRVYLPRLTTGQTKQHEVSSSHIASQPAASQCLDVKSETSDRDVVHYLNTIISVQRGY